MLKLFAVSVILCQLFIGKTLYANQDTHNPKKRQISTEWERPGLYVPGPPPPQPTPQLAQIGRAIQQPSYPLEAQHEDRDSNGQKCDDYNQPMNFEKIAELLKMLYDNFPLSQVFGHECFKTLSGDGNYGVQKLRDWLRRLPNRFPVPSLVIAYMEEPLVRMISIVKFLECVLTRTAWRILMGVLSMGTWFSYTDPYTYYNFLCEDAQYLAGLARERIQIVDNILS